MSNGSPTSSPPMSSSDRVRMFGVRTLGSWPTFRIEYYLSKACGLAMSPWRLIEPPIFIWGPGRSGSYLLYDILSMHPALVCPRSVERFNKGLYGAHHYGGGEYDHLLANPFPPIEGFKRSIGRPHPHIPHTGTWSPADARQIRKRFARMACGGWSTRRVIDKAPWYTYVVDLLEAAFPAAGHICCVRHPNAIAASFYRRMTEPGALDEHGFWGWRPRGWERYVDRPLEDRATWLAIDVMQQARQNEERLGDRCLQVRYEVLVERPRREIERVSRHLDLPSWQGRLEGLPESFPNYNRRAIAPAKDPALRDQLHNLCHALGYEAD